MQRVMVAVIVLVLSALLATKALLEEGQLSDIAQVSSDIQHPNNRLTRRKRGFRFGRRSFRFGVSRSIFLQSVGDKVPKSYSKILDISGNKRSFGTPSAINQETITFVTSVVYSVHKMTACFKLY